MLNDESELLPVLAFSQSCYEGHEASLAADRNPDTTWKAGPYYQWILLDLQKSCRVSSFFLRFPVIDGWYHYHLEASPDRINWDPVFEKRNSAREPANGTFFRMDRVCRYLRLTVTYCSVSDDVEIRDIRVFGHECEDIPASGMRKGRRVFAVQADRIEGFTHFTAEGLEPGWAPRALETDKAGSFIAFRNADFGSGADQLRLCLGTPFKSNVPVVDLRVVLDAPDGPTVGRIRYCRQWLTWSEIAVELLLPDGKPVTGVRDLYVVLDSLDEPQRLQILFLKLTDHPVLSGKIADYREDLAEEPEDGEYKIFFGDMHSHTSFSDAVSTPESAFAYARDVAKIDFLGITEHSNCLDEAFDCDRSRKFRDIKSKADEMTEKDRFVALWGSETTWYNEFGHMNIYCADFYLNSYEYKFDDPLTYYSVLKKYPYIISQWNHPWVCGDRHLDMFRPYDPELDKVTCTVEMNDTELSEEDVIHWYSLPLDAGWHVAPVGNQDNHDYDWGTRNDIRTAVIAKHLSAGHIYDAMRDRRVYYSGTPGIRVIYRLNGVMQGSFANGKNGLRLSVSASVDNPHVFTEILVYGEHEKIVFRDTPRSRILEYTADLPAGQRYYFVKLVRDDGKYAVTAPVWIRDTDV